MAVKIVTDSTSDIPAEIARELDITVVPLLVLFGQESFKDRVDITTDEFYNRLAQGNILPTTTQPHPSVFVDTYQELLKQVDELLVIVLSSKLGGVFRSANNAASIIKGNGHVKVIDSMLATLSLGLVVIEAAKMAQSGMPLNEIAIAVKALIPASNTIVAFDTLKYLSKGGRIGKAQVMLGSRLSVKPVLTFKNGEVSPLTRLRSMSAAADYLYNHVAGIKKIRALGVSHTTARDATDAFVQRLGALYPQDKIYRSSVSPVLGTYMGSNVLSVSFIEEK
ncbi:MAG: DegV family protein [Dehalococcoidia bacterium]|nr:DegV family protein [Dehalococcoidia bacterium]